MTAARLTEIWRHPLKSHGRERLASVALEAGKTLPWDRAWAVAHERSTADGSEWMRCGNFMRVAKAPALAAIAATLDEGRESLTLTHPQAGEITFAPSDPEDAARFLAWVAPLCPKDRPAPARIVSVPGRGMTDSDFPSVTLCNTASHRAVEAQAGRTLSPLRWRGNLWIDGAEAWAEFDWIGREVQVGEAVLVPRARTTRCTATMANPETGLRDADTLTTLQEGWGHTDFSVQAEVVRGGTIREGDAVEIAA